MQNFVFALNATMPIFLVILLGWFLKRIGMLNDGFNKPANSYVFKCALPFNVFLTISGMDLYSDFDAVFCLYCFLVTTVTFLGVWALTWKFMRDRSLVGAFAQAAVRSSASILGIAFAVSIYGDSGMVPMMIMAAVPFFNIYSVLILSFSPQVDEEGRLLPPDPNGGSAVKKACIGVVKNPIVIAIAIGLVVALLRLQLPQILTKTLKMVGDTASPVALLVIGASFSGGAALKKWKPAALASAIKLVALPLVFMPIAIALGFTGSKLIAILIMLGSPTTVTAYVMARGMKQDAVLSSNAVLLSTLLSSVTITLWIYILRSMALI